MDEIPADDRRNRLYPRCSRPAAGFLASMPVAREPKAGIGPEHDSVKLLNRFRGEIRNEFRLGFINGVRRERARLALSRASNPPDKPGPKFVSADAAFQTNRGNNFPAVF